MILVSLLMSSESDEEWLADGRINAQQGIKNNKAIILLIPPQASGKFCFAFP